jgi:hypothetical protein
MPEVISDGPGKPHIINREEDRFGEPLRFSNGRFDLKVSASETRGGMCVFDTIRTERGGLDCLHFRGEKKDLPPAAPDAGGWTPASTFCRCSAPDSACHSGFLRLF